MTRTIVILLVLAGGCSALDPSAMQQPTLYSLDTVRSQLQAVRLPAAISPVAPTLIVNPPRAAAGFDSQRIVYVREAHKREYFAHSEWIDTPARMLAPLIVVAVENSGTFRAVVLTPSAATGDLRLDTEIVGLQHEFDARPSRVRFTLRAYVVDNATRRVVAWREFDEAVPAATENPYGGILAANRAVQTVLGQLADFCTAAAGSWQRELSAAKPGR
jgi:cholesterol transport system auxiliary component